MPATPIDLVGRVAAEAIRQEILAGDADSGFAKLVMHQLMADDMLAIARVVHQDAALNQQVEIALPSHFFKDRQGLPDSVFTTEPITTLRNQTCAKSSRLMALVDESQAQSMANVSKIGRDSLLRKELAEVWLSQAIALENVVLSEETIVALRGAFGGLFNTDLASLRSCAKFILEAVQHAAVEPPRTALGLSLWCLQVPSLLDAFSSVKYNRPSEYQTAFIKQFRNRWSLQKRAANQAVLSKATLEGMFTETAEQLTDEVRQAVRGFIDSGDGWTPASEVLAKMEWSEVRRFFEGAPKARAQTLGEKTEEIFRKLEQDRFDEADWTYVAELKVRGRNAQRGPKDTKYFHKRAREIQEDAGLFAMWEDFIYDRESHCTDFRAGLLLSAHRLRADRATILGPVVVEIIATENDQLKLARKNPQACRYFETRYKHLEKSLAGVVRFRKCEVFQFSSQPDEPGRGGTSRKANQLSFRVRLAATADETTGSSEIRLTWDYQPLSIINGYSGDLQRLVKYGKHHQGVPLIATAVDLDPKGSSAGRNSFSLTDVGAIQPPKRTELGAVVPKTLAAPNLIKDWNEAMDQAVAKGFVTAPMAAELQGLCCAFTTEYFAAVQALSVSELDAPALAKQAEAWSELLGRIGHEVKAEAARIQLLRPLLRIGLVEIKQVESNMAAAVLCPWHPLRIEAQAAVEVRVAQHLRALVRDDALEFSDRTGDLYYQDVQRDLSSAGLPEVGVVWRGEDSVLVAQSDELDGYSLLEPPTADPDHFAATNENPKRTAQQISDIVQSYLALQPHERDNLSIVLYNCDSKQLPNAVVEAISKTSEQEAEETTCQIVLTHEKRQVLAELYESIASQEGDDDAFHVSEASRDFMSRIRINISVNFEVPRTDDGGHPTDIVFCQDVISRLADPSREPLGRLATLPALKLVLHHWSRKRETVLGDNNSVVYLTSPAQTATGWAYLHALSMLKDRDYAERAWAGNACLVPARKLNFDKPKTAQIFRDTHLLGNWVVNFDELLDRRILRHREVRVIRYRQSAESGRNLIISSKANDTLLRATLQQKLGPLLPADTSAEAKESLVTRMIGEANEISGNLVLRAARRGANANELIGLVLSRHLVRTEFAPEQPMFCFLLDDYAEWLGQTEERVADLLVLVPNDGPDGKRLDVIVTEAKFIQFDLRRDAARESGRQLSDSLVLLERAYFSDPPCADQELWLARISDLLLEGIQDLGQHLDVPGWRKAIRDRAFKLSLRGQSHVFIHSPAEMESDGRDFSGIKGSTGEQEVFSRRDVKTILTSFLDPRKIQGLVALRLSMSGMPLERKTYRSIPTRRPQTAANPQPDSAEGGTPVAPPANPSLPPSVPTAVLPPASAEPVALPPAVELPGQSSTPSTPVTDPADEAWIIQMTQRVRHAFLKRELSAEIILAKGTPNALLIQFKGSDRLTIGQLEAKAGELRTTDGLDIISIRPGLGSVIVMIARPDRRTLSLTDAWRSWRPPTSRGNTDILIGIRENDNEPLFLSPYPQPHSLVAGTTGSGKSVLIQNIILGIAATNSPEQAEIVIIDPKQGLDYLSFERLPHLAGSIVITPDEALATLGELVNEMENRYRTFRDKRVQNIDDYLKQGHDPLPRIWVIHDEFGDWMQDQEYRDNVTALVNRLGQKARAAGIYLIFAAQRPENSIFPMVLRSNLANRLVLKVDSPGTSEIATGLKNAGAERLLGRGHLLAILGNLSEPTYAQVPFIDAAEIDKIVESINQKYPR